jgi:class 3 adenylate cyclase
MANEGRPDESEALERRLATILSCDVADYSRLMGSNEEATVQALRGHRAVFEALLRQHHGRIFNTAGDAILAEFPSAVEAVRCATEIQSALQTRNEHVPDEQKMLFRMGINLGDVVVQGGDLLGDGVNVASRIQAVAEPGGICISGSVYDQIQNKLSLQFKSLGDQSFKNIAQPVRTFTITHAESGKLPSNLRRPGSKSPAMVTGVVLGLIALGAAGYWYYRDSESKRAEQAAMATQLEAQKKAAEEARKQADESSKRATEAESKAEREHLVAESTKREAALQAQLASAEDARRRAEADRKRIDDERIKAEEARRQAEARAEAERQEAAKRAEAQRVAEAQRAAEAQNATKRGPAGVNKNAPPNAQPSASAKFDGSYAGQFCNFPNDPARKLCWPVNLQFSGGQAELTWPSRVKGKFSTLHATVADNGTVKATLDGWNTVTEQPLAGALNGQIADNHLEIKGRWANGAPIAGDLARR